MKSLETPIIEMPRAYSISLQLMLALLLACFGELPWVNLLAIFAFGLLLVGYRIFHNQPLLHKLLWLTAIPVGVFIATYRPPNFDYPLIFSVPFLHPEGAPFHLYVNLSKAFAGLLVISFLWVRYKKSLSAKSVTSALIVIASGMVAVILSAHWLLGLPWVLKFPEVTFYFIAVNLFVTCMSEEAFFRLLLQDEIASWFDNARFKVLVPAVIASLLFACAHHPALDAFFLVYAVAGLAYALVYAMTRSFIAAIAVHGGVNIAHFLLLPYPLRN